MAILDKLLEKKDLSAYIDFRLEYLSSIESDELKKLPEKERGFIQERFTGRRGELMKLKSLLAQDKIHDKGIEYWRKLNKEIGTAETVQEFLQEVK